MSKELPNAGDVFMVRYPFVRVTFDRFEAEEDGCSTIPTPSWAPGMEFIGSDDNERVYGIAHGVGSMELTVVSVHKPGRFPTRVFYTRKWINPEGHRFGKGGLRIATVEKFKRLSLRFAHSFTVQEPSPVAPKEPRP